MRFNVFPLPHTRPQDTCTQNHKENHEQLPPIPDCSEM